MTFTEILGLIQRNTNTQNTTTSSYPLADKTTDVNNALNKYFLLANNSEGRWQIDDSNQTDYPIIFGNVISGQQDYSFTVDENGNQILDIYKVRIKDSNGNWTTLKQRDLQDGKDEPLNSTTTGMPTEYDLTANGIFLTVIPNYTLTDALEVYISRTPTYFTVSDTTKKPGIPWTHHEYLAIRPSYYYCLQKGLPQAVRLGEEMLMMEELIKKDYSYRNKDEKPRLIPLVTNNK